MSIVNGETKRNKKLDFLQLLIKMETKNASTKIIRQRNYSQFFRIFHAKTKQNYVKF